MILLMVQNSRIHQLRLVVYPIIYRALYIQTVVGLGISEPSTVGVVTYLHEVPLEKLLRWIFGLEGLIFLRIEAPNDLDPFEQSEKFHLLSTLW